MVLGVPAAQLLDAVRELRHLLQQLVRVALAHLQLAAELACAPAPRFSRAWAAPAPTPRWRRAGTPPRWVTRVPRRGCSSPESAGATPARIFISELLPGAVHAHEPHALTLLDGEGEILEDGGLPRRLGCCARRRHGRLSWPRAQEQSCGQGERGRTRFPRPDPEERGSVAAGAGRAGRGRRRRRRGRAGRRGTRAALAGALPPRLPPPPPLRRPPPPPPPPRPESRRGPMASPPWPPPEASDRARRRRCRWPPGAGGVTPERWGSLHHRHAAADGALDVLEVRALLAVAGQRDAAAPARGRCGRCGARRTRGCWAGRS